jgi:Domain of unknown function (DUF4292)
MKTKIFLLIGVIGLVSMQCGTGRKAAHFEPPQPATSTREANDILTKIEQRIAQSADIRTLSAKARLTVSGDNGTISANAQLSWYRDSILWVTVKKFGLEAARALVTRDSVYMLDRLNKTYTVKSLESLQYEFSLPGQADFKMIGEVLLGLPTFFPNVSVKSDIHEQQHRLLVSTQQLLAEYRIEEGSFLTKSEAFLQSSQQRSIGLTFDRHQSIEGSKMLFPIQRHIEAYSSASGKQEIEVEFSDILVNTNPPTKFEIPAHYQKSK